MSPRAFRAPDVADEARYAPEALFAAGLANHHISNTAYPIAHERTFAPYRVERESQRQVVVDAFAGIQELGLYVHVPFCDTRCAFCEYTVVKRSEAERAREYVEALLAEIELWHQAIDLGGRSIAGIDLGGGTPTYLPVHELARILAALRARVSLGSGADVSIETTPRIAAAEPEKIAALRGLGIDRISMGVQVAEPDLLRLLARDANGVEEQRRAADAIHRAGFERFNVDLMYGFAGQSLESWRATLEHAVALGPDAITLYRMRYKLTRISHQASEVELAQVRPMITLAKELLGARGYRANPGKTTLSRRPGAVGTSSYLERRVRDGLPYLGLGLGAQSFTTRTLSYADGAVGKNLAPYLKSVAQGRLPLQDLYDLPLRHAMGKMCAVSFYFGEIDRQAFQARFGVELGAAFAQEIDWLVRNGLMQWTDRSLQLTARGALEINGVIALFFAPSVQAELLARSGERTADFSRARARALRVAGLEPSHV